MSHDRHGKRRGRTLAAMLALLLGACTSTGRQGGASPENASAGSLEAQELPEPVLEPLESALVSYDTVRSRLAHDDLDGTKAEAQGVVSDLREAATKASGLPPRLARVLEETVRVAESLAGASDLDAARSAFGELSRLLLVLANVDPRLAEGWHVFSCPMTKTFPKWMQRSSDVENPFMGQAMPSCGTPSDLEVTPPASSSEAEAHIEHAHEGDVAYYTCSMHPSVRREGPGTCPICSMDLIPVTREEVDTGVLFVDAQRRQAIGIRTEPVRRAAISVRIRAVGKVLYDETRLSEVSLKVEGWIGRLYADARGEPVRRGEPLFTLYSPELYAAQEELLTALESQRAAAGTGTPDRADYLVAAARRKLLLWDLSEEAIDAVAQRGEPTKYLPIPSPVSGYVVEKNVVEGARVAPGTTLYRVAALDRVWVEAEVYESELGLVRVGQEAEVTLTYLPGRRFRGRVSYVYPFLDDRSRTGRIRIELANPGLALKPDMYATVEIREELGERLVVPDEAVLYVGPRRLVFLDLGDGRLRPQEIAVGIRSQDVYEVLSGLEEGDVVVTSGNFLIAAESRIKSATRQW